MNAALSHALAIVAATAVGWSIVTAALAVLHHMDLRCTRLLQAAGWLATAAAGAWMGVVPAATGHPLPWPMVMIGLSLAVVVWTNLPALMAQSTRPRPRTRVVSFVRAQRARGTGDAGRA